jgi:hypothetical protein
MTLNILKYKKKERKKVEGIRKTTPSEKQNPCKLLVYNGLYYLL